MGYGQYELCVNVWGLDICHSRVSIYLFVFPSLFFLLAASMSLFPYCFLPSLSYIVLTFLRAERCARASRGGDVRLRRPTPTHRRFGTRSPADDARGACRRRRDLWGCAGNRAQRAGTTCDAHRMQWARAPTLTLDSPLNYSLFDSLDSPFTRLPPLTASHPHQKGL
ncbi:hypothetical protein B0H13DRAFT_1961463 [Mycena leptocephala]|nr:hypothetical protein B0H13DRAFT_1961463 [Mycena leptocephala]